TARLHVTANRLPAAPELRRNPPDPPAQPLQPHHRSRLVRRPHQIPPQIVNPRRTCIQIVHLQTSSHSEAVQFLMSPRAQFSMSPDSAFRRGLWSGSVGVCPALLVV